MMEPTFEELIEWIDGEAVSHKATQPTTRKAIMLGSIRTRLLIAQKMAAEALRNSCGQYPELNGRAYSLLEEWEGK